MKNIQILFIQIKIFITGNKIGSGCDTYINLQYFGISGIRHNVNVHLSIEFHNHLKQHNYFHTQSNVCPTSTSWASPPNHNPAISNYPTYDYWSAAASCSVVMLNVPFDVWLLWGKWLESGKGQNWIAADKGLLCKCKYSPEYKLFRGQCQGCLLLLAR